jgi:carbonic anhydrase
MSAVSELFEANQRYAEVFGYGALPMPPGRRLAILTCMDARVDPAKALGLKEGDAHVIRNAGGRASDDALRSLIISQQLLGTREVIVMHHTDCGMLTFTNDQLRDVLSERFGVAAEEIDFLPFSDEVQCVRDDVATIRSSPWIPDDVPVTGLIYDVHTGLIQEVT